MNLSTVKQWKKMNVSAWICYDMRSVGRAMLSRVLIDQGILRRGEVLNEPRLGRPVFIFHFRAASVIRTTGI
jgi:hypothetical protein